MGITFEQIKSAAESIKTTDIKGKEYAEVNQRIKVFRMLWPEGTIETELVSNVDGVCMFKARILNEEGKLLGTGTAFEKQDSSFINKTSYIENCETSAVGRALAMCGIGIDVSIASAEEVANAIENQEKPSKSKAAKKVDNQLEVIKVLKTKSDAYKASVLNHYQIERIEDLTEKQCEDFINALKKKGEA